MMTSRPTATFAPTFAPAFSSFPEMERLMGAFVSPQPARAAAFHPPVNVWEDEHALHVESELPGYTLENLNITTLGDELTIAGSRQVSTPENNAYLRRERSAGATEFSRTLKIGIPFDAEKVQASLKQGVLTITLPKVAAAKPRKIEVKTA
jgi:HSP20 family protein